jgi:hypothetical protein
MNNGIWTWTILWACASWLTLVPAFQAPAGPQHRPVESLQDAPDVGRLRDITGIEKEPVPDHSLPFWLWLVVTSLAGVLLLSWKLRPRSGSKKREIPPDRWALAELDRIECLGLPEAEEVERYHTLLSDTIRRYLEFRYQLPATQQTTPEFLQTVNASDLLTTEQQIILSQFLENCDLAKFARVGFSQKECRQAAQMARELVIETAS